VEDDKLQCESLEDTTTPLEEDLEKEPEDLTREEEDLPTEAEEVGSLAEDSTLEEDAGAAPIGPSTS
jgi:hypothetical protein